MITANNRINYFRVFLLVCAATGLLTGCTAKRVSLEINQVTNQDQAGRDTVFVRQPDLQKYSFPWLADPRSGQWSVAFYDLDADSLIFGYNQNLALLPASVQKLLTTAAALKTLGADYSATTEIRCDGEVDADGTLQGNLLVYGGHDPSLGNGLEPGMAVPELTATVRFIKEKAGIRKIKGSLLFPQMTDQFLTYPAGWEYEDLNTWYAPLVSPLSFGGNTVSLKMSRDTLQIVPQYPLRIRRDTLSWVSTIFRRVALTDSLIVTSDFRNAFTEKIPVTHPELLFKTAFSKALRDGGVELTDEPNAAGSERVLYRIQGRKMVDLIKRCNNNSDNFYAEQVFHLLVQKYVADSAISKAKVTYPEERAALAGRLYRSLWKSGDLAVTDGCGLSRRNYLSAELLITVLKDMQRDKNFEVYLASMAQPGREGTLRKRFLSETFTDKLFAKTGSMSGVNNLAGYLVTSKGRRIAFAVLNNFYFLPKAELNSRLEEMLTVISLRN